MIPVLVILGAIVIAYTAFSIFKMAAQMTDRGEAEIYRFDLNKMAVETEPIIEFARSSSGRFNNPVEMHAKRKTNRLKLKAKAKRKRIRKGK